MTPTKPHVFRVAHLFWATGLAMALVASDGRLTAQTTRTNPPQTAPPATNAPKPGTSTQGTASQGTATQGAAGQGANANPANQGRGGPTNPGNRSFVPWWKDEAIKKELGLSADQVTRIEKLFTDRARDTEALGQEMDKQRAELGKLMADRTTDARTMVKAIELQTALLEVPRSKLNESYNVMLFRMRRVLTAEQDKKLQEMSDRNRGRGGM